MRKSCLLRHSCNVSPSADGYWRLLLPVALGIKGKASLPNNLSNFYAHIDEPHGAEDTEE